MADARGEPRAPGVWTCEFCRGASGKERASKGARRCTSNAAPHKCRDALTAAIKTEKQELATQNNRRVKRARDGLDEQQQNTSYAALIAAKECLSITEVLGASHINVEALSEGEQRGGVAVDEYSPAYLVRGRFGNVSDQKSALLPGTRWVELVELMENCPGQWALLEAFDKGLAEEMAGARRLIAEELAEKERVQ